MKGPILLSTFIIQSETGDIPPENYKDFQICRYNIIMLPTAPPDPTYTTKLAILMASGNLILHHMSRTY